MKATVCPRYGPPEVLQFMDVDKPVPKDDEVLVKVCAAAVNPLDLFCMRGAPLLRRIPGLDKPKRKILGMDVAGRVEALGRNAKLFQPGDEVFGGPKELGAFAEYVCVRENQLAGKPGNLSFEEAAAMPVAAITVLQGLRDQGRIKPGQRVVVDGASGGLGTFAVQIAKSFGAEVTAVCSTGKMETAQSLDADHVIDYTRQDFTKSAGCYDLILGANAHHSFFDYMRALNENGIFVLAGGAPGRILEGLVLGWLLSRVGRKKTRFFIANINHKDLVVLKALVEAGKIMPVIDRRYPLSDVAGALRYLEQHHARGKIVITSG
jgi:NADPH:quinone reductase-like Zn-dependent oxidoreductase